MDNKLYDILTKNGKGAYSIHSIDDDEEFEKAKAMVRLLTELNRGFRSGDEKGWISEDEVEEHFRIRRERAIEEQNG